MVSLEKRSTFEIILKGWQISTSDFQSWVFNKDLMKSLHSCRHIFSPAQQNMKQTELKSEREGLSIFISLPYMHRNLTIFLPPPRHLPLPTTESPICRPAALLHPSSCHHPPSSRVLPPSPFFGRVDQPRQWLIWRGGCRGPSSSFSGYEHEAGCSS